MQREHHRFKRVAEIGDILILKELTLKGVFHVPNSKCNLLSVSKLIKNYNYIAKFLKLT